MNVRLYAFPRHALAVLRGAIIKLFFFLLFLSGTAENLKAQQKTDTKIIDSLMLVLEKAEAAQKPKIYDAISQAYYAQQRFGDAIRYGKEGLMLAKKRGDLKQEAVISVTIGTAFLNKGDFDSAGYFINNGYRISSKNGDLETEGRSLSGLSNVLGRKGLYDSSIHVLTRALSIFSQTKDSLQLAIAHTNLGNRYSSTGDFARALLNHHKALTIFEILNLPDRARTTHIAIGNTYNNMGDEEKALEHYKKVLNDYDFPMTDHYRAVLTNNIGGLLTENNKFEEARPYLLEAWNIWGKDSTNCFAIYPLGNLGEVYSQTNRLDSAERLLLQAVRRAKKCNEQYVVSASMLDLSKVYSKLSKPDLAKRLLDESYTIASRIRRNDILKEASYLLYEYYKSRGNYAQALKYFELHKATSDSLLNEEGTKKMAKMEATFEFAQEKKEIEWQHQQAVFGEQLKLKRQTTLNRTYLAGAGVLLVLVLLIYRSYRIKRHANHSLAIKNDEITRQKTALEAMNHTKEKLLSVLSHDLKNPLFGLEGSLNMFLDGAMPQERLQKHVRDLQVRLHNTSDFLENLLQWTKGQLTGIKPNKISFHAAKVLDETINLLEPAARTKQVLLIPSVSSGLILYGDYEMVKVVLRNLVTNAIKFSPESESITIAINRAGQTDLISVHDHGAGIKTEQQKVFSSVGFSEKGTKGETGTGIGLMLCREFVEKHGGRIWFESSEGGGTTFFFTLPVNAEAGVMA
jgi:signal transduction histidine kinase/Tfp pilus assembly protein PilF